MGGHQARPYIFMRGADKINVPRAFMTPSELQTGPANGYFGCGSPKSSAMA